MSKDYYKNERIQLALEKVKEAQSLEDIAVVVTKEGMPLFTTIFENSMRRIIQEEMQKATRELALGFLKGLLPEEDRGPTYELLPKDRGLSEKARPDWFYEEPKAPKKDKPKPRKGRGPRAAVWSEEEIASYKEQFMALREINPQASVSSIVSNISIPGRSEKAITNYYQRKLKKELQNK